MNEIEVPEAYQIGWVPFIHTEIHLDSRPLIPRTETEYWVDLAIKKMKMLNRTNLRVLDLCAGSGCIGVAALKEIPEAIVDFVEIDGRHHALINKNLLVNGIEPKRAQIFGGDLFEKIAGKYDFILSNPPYVATRLKDRVEESVLAYEPEKALFSGDEGLDIIKEILFSYAEFLNPGGELFLEHEPEQVAFLRSNNGYEETQKDQFGLLRFSRFTKP